MFPGKIRVRHQASFKPIHALNISAGKKVWVSFLEASSLVQKTPLIYQKSIVSSGDIFIIIKASTQQEIIGYLTEPMCKFNPLPQQEQNMF